MIQLKQPNYANIAAAFIDKEVYLAYRQTFERMERFAKREMKKMYKGSPNLGRKFRKMKIRIIPQVQVYLPNTNNDEKH